MHQKVVVAGATGNLGGKIVDALLAKGVEVVAIVRRESDQKKIALLQNKGVIVAQVNTKLSSEIAEHCHGASCMVSALAGLKEVIIDTQKVFLDAAVEAKVPRFIPSDYAIDFTNLIEGKNRNLDLRRDFHKILAQAPIQAISIFNGPFMELLTGDMPLIMFKQGRILCWGNPDQKIEFTTTFNIASFTAEAALDATAPRYLRIAGDVLTCNDFTNLMTELTGKTYKIFRPGGISLLNFVIKMAHFFSPSPKELYPAWQGMQYMRDMMEGRVIFQKYDNDRFPALKWTSVKDYLISENVKMK